MLGICWPWLCGWMHFFIFSFYFPLQVFIFRILSPPSGTPITHLPVCLSHRRLMLLFLRRTHSLMAHDALFFLWSVWTVFWAPGALCFVFCGIILLWAYAIYSSLRMLHFLLRYLIFFPVLKWSLVSLIFPPFKKYIYNGHLKALICWFRREWWIPFVCRPVSVACFSSCRSRVVPPHLPGTAHTRTERPGQKSPPQGRTCSLLCRAAELKSWPLGGAPAWAGHCAGHSSWLVLNAWGLAQASPSGWARDASL